MKRLQYKYLKQGSEQFKIGYHQNAMGKPKIPGRLEKWSGMSNFKTLRFIPNNL